MSDLELCVGAKVFNAWTEVRVSRSLERLAAEFQLGYTGRDARDEVRSIRTGEYVQIKAHGELAVSGYVEAAEEEYSSSSHRCAVAGRSLAGDLVDCAAGFGRRYQTQWRDASLTTIATALCEPFKVKVKVSGDVGAAFAAFSLEQGETVFSALERLGRMRGLIVTSLPGGTVLFTRAGSSRTRTVIERGVNVLSGSRRDNWTERYRDYHVISQGAVDQVLQIVHKYRGTPAGLPPTASDSGVRRHRPVVIHAEDGETDLTARGVWERNVRAGRSRRLVYTVHGWRRDGGLWSPNLLVRVKDDELGVDGELLVVTATLLLDRNGQRTELELTNRASFTEQPLPPVRGFLAEMFG